MRDRLHEQDDRHIDNPLEQVKADECEWKIQWDALMNEVDEWMIIGIRQRINVAEAVVPHSMGVFEKVKEAIVKYEAMDEITGDLESR